ncbi:MAG: hypothetical protein JWO62_1988 [Acidimicrobiaceae bacterium]|nr:hypothetical protein [Acidimicrobiaceae bacterium]
MSESAGTSSATLSDEMSIGVTADGPYVVSGGVPIARHVIVADNEGGSVGWQQGESFGAGEEYHLCRCGQSANKPFCGESHQRVRFNGTETASSEP